MPPATIECLIGLGSNLGDRRATLDAAVKQIAAANGVELLAASGWSANPAVGGPGEQGDFLNGVSLVSTTLPPDELLGCLRKIESGLGRERRQRWAERTLDADVLLYGDQVLDLPQLQVPHPRMSFRPFVMGPAVEIAPDKRHPQLAATLAELDDRRRTGGDQVALAGGSPRDREAVRVELAGWGGAFGVLLDPQPTDEPKLQVCLDAEATLPGVPALWLSPGDRGRWRTELAAAVTCVWALPSSATAKDASK